MSDENPPSAFNWNLAPKKPEVDEPAEPVVPPVQPPPVYQPPAAFEPPPVYHAPPAYQTPPAFGPPPVYQPPPAYQAPPVYQAPPTYQAPPAFEPPPEPAPTEAYQVLPTGSYGFPPTEQYAGAPTEAFSFDSSIAGPTELLGAAPVGLPELRDEGLRPAQPGSAIDSLFGESQFQEYDTSAFPSEGISALASTRPREAREPLGRTQKILLSVAGGLLAVLALVGVFVLGTHLSGLIPKPVAAGPAVPKPNASLPALRAPVVGPVAVGVHEWNTLLGTECLDPYASAWDEKYTVVDCTAPHAAQLVAHGTFSDEAFAPYPGAATLQSRMNLLCTSPGSIDYAVASQFADIQVSSSYAADQAQWDAGDRDYYCFVTRSGGSPFTSGVAVAPVASDAIVATVPGNDP